MTVTLYGIPSCGTVRKAPKWLDQQGIASTWVDFRTTAPKPERPVVEIDGEPATVGFKEPVYAELFCT
jgi:glutaredoxin